MIAEAAKQQFAEMQARKGDRPLIVKAIIRNGVVVAYEDRTAALLDKMRTVLK